MPSTIGCLCGNGHLIVPICWFFSPLNQDLNEDYEIHFSFHLDFDSMTQSFPLKIVFSMVDCKEESNYDLALFFLFIELNGLIGKKKKLSLMNSTKNLQSFHFIVIEWKIYFKEKI